MLGRVIGKFLRQLQVKSLHTRYKGYAPGDFPRGDLDHLHPLGIA